MWSYSFGALVFNIVENIQNINCIYLERELFNLYMYANKIRFILFKSVLCIHINVVLVITFIDLNVYILKII